MGCRLLYYGAGLGGAARFLPKASLRLARLPVPTQPSFNYGPQNLRSKRQLRLSPGGLLGQTQTTMSIVLSQGESAIATLPDTGLARRPLNNRDRFLDACHCRPTDRPPVWMMRQAGRCLPEYRALKERHSFLELVRTPNLATEVTLQPIRRFGFDAAILFSDILVVPEALGQGYRFRDTGGIEMDFAVNSAADIRKLSVDAIEDRLSYVTEALLLIKRQLRGETALIGFAGAPWTLANFMLEGGSAKNPGRGLEMLRQNPTVLNLLLEKLTAAVSRYLRQQIRAGVDAVQIFDTHGGLLPSELFQAGSGQWLRRIVEELDGEVPVIVFSKGCRNWDSLFNLGANVLGIGPEVDLAEARRTFPADLAMQGNLDPDLLERLGPEELRLATSDMLRKMRGRPGYIFNLGHGVPPGAPLENIAAVVNTVQSSHEQT